MHTVAFQVGIFLVALLGGLAGGFPVFVLGLFMPGEVVLPLVVLLAGELSALGAAWTANALTSDGSTSDLVRIVAVVEVAAAVLAGVLFGLTYWATIVWPFPASPLLFTVLALALVSTAASQRFRKDEGSLGRDGWVTLGLIVAGVLVVVVAVPVTCSVAQCVP